MTWNSDVLIIAARLRLCLNHSYVTAVTEDYTCRLLQLPYMVNDMEVKVPVYDITDLSCWMLLGTALRRLGIPGCIE